jgi:predicted transcriptional regulator
MPIFKDRYIKLTPETLRGLMAQHDVNQAELADIIESHQPIIALMLSGKRAITARMTTRIYDGLEWYLSPTPVRQRKKEQKLIARIIANLPTVVVDDYTRDFQKDEDEDADE